MSRNVRRFFSLFVLLVLLVVALRLLLPGIVLKYVNRVLNSLPEYKASVGDIDIALIRGAYVIKEFSFKKRQGSGDIPFIYVPEADLSVQWGALFDGKLVGEIEFEKPQINLVSSSSENERQISTKGDWQGMVRDLFPLKINRTAINGGYVSYRYEGKSDPIAVEVDGINGTLTGLSNRQTKAKNLPANADFTGRIQKISDFKVKAKLEPLAKEPTFDLDFNTGVIPLESFNTLLTKALGVDSEGGSIQFFSEVACNSGNIEGYVKPILKDVKILSLSNDGINPIYIFWESLVSFVTEIFTNQRHDQFAAKIPIEGKINNADLKSFKALRTIFENAFIKAFKANLDGSINFDDINKESQ